MKKSWQTSAFTKPQLRSYCCALIVASGVLEMKNACAQSADEIARMSIEDLGSLQITSVSKKAQSLSDAAAAVFVITREDIRRSGAQSIPELLRLAPNLQVARVDASQYAITARGFNATTANKLLVLIDGRSVYTPLYSGVFWDVPDVMLENIERIEVISGSGGTLWGANAVNGVISIITRDAYDTQNTFVSVAAGNLEDGIALHHGARLGENAAYRLSAHAVKRSNTFTAKGVDQQDDWSRKNLDFHLDWHHADDALMFALSAYDGDLNQKIVNDKAISGTYALARWNRKLGDKETLQVQTYLDSSKRIHPGTFGEARDTYDIDIQHSFSLGAQHDIVWGGNYRRSSDDVSNSAILAFLPAQRSLTQLSVFLQDNISLNEQLQLVLGVKCERNSFTGIEWQPNLRLAWKLPDQALLWSAISRAVRTPSRIDTDLYAPGNPPHTIFAGGPNFKSEKLTAYELGYRLRPISGASLSVSTFYNAYDALRSVEVGPPTTLANKLAGDTYGVEIWGNYDLSSSWRMLAGFNYLKKSLRLQPGSRDITSVNAGTDPAHQFLLRSSMNLRHDIEFDATLRAIGALPNPQVPSYVGLDLRLSWIVSPQLALSVSGTNLLNRNHAEFGAAPGRSEIGRSVFVKMTWKL